MTEKEKQSAKIGSLIEYRKKRKRKNAVKKLRIVLIIVVLALIISANFGAIAESFRGIASKIDTKTSNEIGFPIKLSGGASYSFDSFGDNFSLLTDTYLYTYAMNGGQNYAVRHGYSKPVQCTNSNRILLYDKDYNNFSLYNKTRLIYSSEVEDKIVFASLGAKNSAAIVTNSERYSNIVYIYDGNGEWRYTRKFFGENIMNVVFSSDERYIYLSAVGVKNGEMYSAVYKYDITDEADALWSYERIGASFPVKMYVRNEKVFVLYDNCAVSLKENDGTLVGDKTFSGTVLCCDISDNVIGVVSMDASSNKKQLIAMDYGMNVISSKTVDININRISADDGIFYVISSTTLLGLNSKMETITEKFLSDSFISFLKIGNSVLLLGYNTVDKINV